MMMLHVHVMAKGNEELCELRSGKKLLSSAPEASPKLQFARYDKRNLGVSRIAIAQVCIDSL
jgi:hypothetical protein